MFENKPHKVKLSLWFPLRESNVKAASLVLAHRMEICPTIGTDPEFFNSRAQKIKGLQRPSGESMRGSLPDSQPLISAPEHHLKYKELLSIF